MDKVNEMCDGEYKKDKDLKMMQLTLFLLIFALLAHIFLWH